VRQRELTVALMTVGCKLNQYESEGIAERLEEAGFRVVPFTSSAHVYVVNTCTVTSRSDYKSRQMLRRAARGNPDALIVACGCYAQRDPAALDTMPEVDLVVGNEEKTRLPGLVTSRLAEKIVDDAALGVGRGSLAVGPSLSSKESPATQLPSWNDEERFRFFDITGFRGYTRAFVKIQDGCDRRCSYCAVPDARGPARSRPPAEVVRQAEVLAEHGYREIVLTGVHIGAYAAGGSGLSDLLEALTGVDGLDRLRLGSLEPTELTPRVAATVVNSPKIMNHLHVPLQSGSDRVLRGMGRPYTAAQYRDAVKRVTSADARCGLGADVMVGFPGETDEDFADTFSLIESLPFTYLHVFTFSPRRGTSAASLPGRVPGEEARRRSRALRELGKRKSLTFRRSLEGVVLDVLIEGRAKLPRGRVGGLASNYVRVEMPGDEDLSNRIAGVRIREADGQITRGEIVPGTIR
jgi:threonylcarbamoyladenosine tRNA methylthiotransferase MtaB